MQEDERDPALCAELDEVCAFEGGFGEEDPVVGEDADGVVVDSPEAFIADGLGMPFILICGRIQSSPVTKVSP